MAKVAWSEPVFEEKWEMFITDEQKVLRALAMQLMNGDEVVMWMIRSCK
jgi:hypothetical protein